jgi:hypothetical protein
MHACLHARSLRSKMSVSFLSGSPPNTHHLITLAVCNNTRRPWLRRSRFPNHNLQGERHSQFRQLCQPESSPDPCHSTPPWGGYQSSPRSTERTKSKQASKQAGNWDQGLPEDFEPDHVVRRCTTIGQLSSAVKHLFLCLLRSVSSAPRKL